MRKKLIVLLIIIGGFSFSAKIEKTELKVSNIEVQMKKAEKIESYKSKKDISWHKTEYNNVLKYLNKSKK